MFDLYGFDYVPSPWFRFRINGSRYQYCQPDGLLLSKDQITCVEVKYAHTSGAYFQLEGRYIPLLRAYFPHHKIAGCEVVKWFDPSTRFPTEVVMREAVHLAAPGEFAVHILNKLD